MDEVKRPTERGIVLHTRVCGRGIIVLKTLLCNLFNIPHGGVVPTRLSIVKEQMDYYDDDVNEQAVLGEEFWLQKVIEYSKSRAVVEVGLYVDLEATDFEGDLRMIHYAVNRSITPKKDT